MLGFLRFGSPRLAWDKDTDRASSRPETALFCNLGVKLRISLCDVQGYVSAEILVFLDLAEKPLVSASRTALSPPEFLDGNGLDWIREV